ncbi:MAG: hypothetical protein WBG92_13250, partial [Thiohalocapsa sp.]
FSRDRTLTETIKRLVQESVAGWTSRELQDLLHVRVQVLLLDAVRSATVVREKLGGFYVYVHAERAVRELQLQRRRAQVPAGQSAPLAAGVESAKKGAARHADLAACACPTSGLVGRSCRGNALAMT